MSLKQLLIKLAQAINEENENDTVEVWLGKQGYMINDVLFSTSDRKAPVAISITPIEE